MTYGLEYSNDNNQVLIDSQHPVYVLSSAVTLSGTWQKPFTGFDGFYSYDLAATGKLPFGNILDAETGDYFGFGYSFEEAISSKPNLSIRYAVNVANVVAAGTYGMELRDASGNVTYVSNADVVPISGVHRENPDTFNNITTGAAEWFSWINPIFAVAPASPTTSVVYFRVCERVNSTTVKPVNIPVSTYSPAGATYLPPYKTTLLSG